MAPDRTGFFPLTDSMLLEPVQCSTCFACRDEKRCTPLPDAQAPMCIQFQPCRIDDEPFLFLLLAQPSYYLLNFSCRENNRLPIAKNAQISFCTDFKQGISKIEVVRCHPHLLRKKQDICCYPFYLQLYIIFELKEKFYTVVMEALQSPFSTGKYHHVLVQQGHFFSELLSWKEEF